MKTSWAEANLCCPAFAFAIVNGVHETSVVPVLNHVVRAVMNLHFDRVTPIVDQEDYALLSASNHGRYILSCDLSKGEDKSLEKVPSKYKMPDGN